MDWSQFVWTREPESYALGEDRLEVVTKPHTDLWQRTYYHFQNDNAPVFQMETEEPYFSFVVKTEFFESSRRFDQCGVVLYLDSENWLKGSVEYENQEYQHLGTVVTNQGYSDWATTVIDAGVKEMWYRLSRREDDYRVECSTDGENFEQMRICHMHKGGGKIRFGVYACSPEDSSFRAVFSHLRMTECQWSAHNGQQPDEKVSRKESVPKKPAFCEGGGLREYWDRSWAKVDMNQVEKSIRCVEMFPDPVMDYLKEQKAETVCDAGCGCGVYSVKLVLNGFQVFGFDTAAAAVEIAEGTLARLAPGLAHGEFRVSGITATGYEDGRFDAVVSRSVIDHMTFREGAVAVRELCRIVRAGGSIIITLDELDEEYEREPHTVTAEGDYLFTGGKWEGMVFHPYSESEILKLAPPGTKISVKTSAEGLQAVLVK